MTDPDQTTGRFTKWYTLGVDMYGSRHIVNFQKKTVYVVTASGQLEHVERLWLDGATVDDWMGFVEKDDQGNGRGWLDKRYGVPLVEHAAQVVEGGA